jgi:hypothetical protein
MNKPAYIIYIDAHGCICGKKTTDIKHHILVDTEAAYLIINELAFDKGIDFNVKDYLMLNLGAFLLMFAISAISFFR